MGDTENISRQVALDDYEEPDIFGPSFPVGDHDRDIDDDAIWRPETGAGQSESPGESPLSGIHSPVRPPQA